MALVQQVVDEKNLNRTMSGGWWESFCRHHPNLSLCAAAPLSLVHAKASNPEMLCRYFDILDCTFDDNNLRGKPGQIFNMDESGMIQNLQG